MKKLLVISLVLGCLACSQRTTPVPVISDENVVVNPPAEIVPGADEDVTVTEEAADEVLPTCDEDATIPVMTAVLVPTPAVDEDATPVLPTEDATPTSDETTD